MAGQNLPVLIQTGAKLLPERTRADGSGSAEVAAKRTKLVNSVSTPVWLPGSKRTELRSSTSRWRHTGSSWAGRKRDWL